MITLYRILETYDVDPSEVKLVRHGNKHIPIRETFLEIVPATTTPDAVIECENRWKEKLGTRKFGLNKN